MTISSPLAIDQQQRQVDSVRALAPINGANIIGGDGSKTPPQVLSMASPLDGEMNRPSTIGNDFYRKARDIRRDPTIRMMRELSIAPILMSEWEYEDLGAPPGALDLIKGQMESMRLRLLRTSLLGVCDYGWQPYEVVADARTDGTNGLRLKPLLQDITVILVDAADGSFFGLRQTPYLGLRVGWIYLLDRDRECFVVSQDVEGTNWYGDPTLRSLEPWYDEGLIINKNARKYDAKIAGTHWVIYFPLGVSKYNGVDTDNGEVARQLLCQAEAVGGIIVPRSVIQAMDAMNAALASSEATQWKIELLTDKGSGLAGFSERLKYIDTLKVRAFGFPERSVLEGQFGTKAESESQGSLAVPALEVRHCLLTEQYNTKLVDLILEWNYGWDARESVRIKPTPLQDDKLAFFEKLYLAMIANPQGFMTEVSGLDSHQLRERLGLPELDQLGIAKGGVYDPSQMTYDPFDPSQGGGTFDPLPAITQYPQQDARTQVSFALGYDPDEARDEKGQWSASDAPSDFSSLKKAVKKAAKDGHAVENQFGMVIKNIRPLIEGKVSQEAKDAFNRRGTGKNYKDSYKGTAIKPDGAVIQGYEFHATAIRKIHNVPVPKLSRSFALNRVDDAASLAQKPTSKQREAGNYRKGHVTLHGLDIAIETPKGKKRRKEWPRLPAHYGYIKGTTGADDSQVDCFIGPKLKSKLTFVADLCDEHGDFDEHKVMLGYKSADRAMNDIMDAYGDDAHRICGMKTMTIDQLKSWLAKGKRNEAVT